MHLAQLFHGKFVGTILCVRRRWPLVIGEEVDSTFYKNAVLVQFDLRTKQFRAREDGSRFVLIAPEFLNDSSWKCSTLDSPHISDEKEFADIQKAYQARQFGLYVHSLIVYKGVFKLVEKVRDSAFKNVKLLRV